MGIALIAMSFLVPVTLIILCQRFAILDRVGVVVLAFASGIVLASSIDLPAVFQGVDVQGIQTQVTELSIALAVPLLVFSMNVRQAVQRAGPTLRSMVLALIAVLLMTTVLAWLFQDRLHPIWQIAGMAVGAYTGGGPNMAAIKTAIEGDQAVFVTMTTYDILLSAIYLLFVMTLAKPVFGRFLPAYLPAGNRSPDKVNYDAVSVDTSNDYAHLSDESARAYARLLAAGQWRASLKSLFFALLAVALSVLGSQLFPDSARSMMTIILITSFGLLFSLVPVIHRLKSSFQLGMYLILVFCFTMGAMTDVAVLGELNGQLFAYIGLLLAGAMCLHALACRMFGIDTDTFLIASSAAIMSVPFIPVIAGALKNRELIVPGFAAAILGYALGNYLGIMMAYAVRWWVG